MFDDNSDLLWRFCATQFSLQMENAFVFLQHFPQCEHIASPQQINFTHIWPNCFLETEANKTVPKQKKVLIRKTIQAGK